MVMRYKEPLFRPPAEANSLIFQAAYGCPNNTCTFCGMYKGKKYSERDPIETFSDIAWAKEHYRNEKRVFLADGDVMFMRFDRIEAILKAIHDAFPHLARVNMYANSSSILGKSAVELKRLKELRLNTLYIGLESGSNEVLKILKKKDTAEQAIEAVQLANQCGLKCSVMVLLGAGGKALTQEHAQDTIKIVNAMQPAILSLLTMIPVPGTALVQDISKGHFIQLNKEEILLELREMILGFELNHTVFRCNHTSNPLPLEGRFPKDKESLIAQVDAMLRDKEFLNDEEWTSPWML